MRTVVVAEPMVTPPDWAVLERGLFVLWTGP